MNEDGQSSIANSARPVVRIFDHTLMWPLLLNDTRHPDQRGPSEATETLDQWAGQIEATGVWKQISDPARDEEYRQPYEEIVYFHPFVRKFLYDRPAAHQDTQDPEFDEGVRLFERDDIVGVRTKFPNGQDQVEPPLVLAVSKVQLFLFDTFVAIVVIRLTNSPDPVRLNLLSSDNQRALTPINLDIVLAFQEVFRRCYPPFWKVDDKSAQPVAGLCPESVEWLLHPQATAVAPTQYQSDYADQPGFRQFVGLHVQSPVARHFQYVLEPLVPFQSRNQASPNGRWLAYRQILDERIPVMSYIAVDDPQSLTDADYFRITFCDSPGKFPRHFPYSIKSPDVARFPGDYVYDRFYGPNYRDHYPDRDKGTMYTTRYLCSGYSFAVVGDVGNYEFKNHIRPHMQRHYFKLGLIAHFGRASLLAFDDRLAYAVQARNRDEAQFRAELKLIEDDFVVFRSRYWFSEVSNHTQAREIFEWWGKHLEIDSLFKQVEGKVHTVNEVLERQDTQSLNQRIERLTNLSIGVALVSLVVAVVTLSRDLVDCHLSDSPLLWCVWCGLSLAAAAGILALVRDFVKFSSRLLPGKKAYGDAMRRSSDKSGENQT